MNTNPDEIQKTHKHIVNFFDQFHFHYATSLLPDYQDLEIIKHKGKKNDHASLGKRHPIS